MTPSLITAMFSDAPDRDFAYSGYLSIYFLYRGRINLVSVQSTAVSSSRSVLFFPLVLIALLTMVRAAAPGACFLFVVFTAPPKASVLLDRVLCDENFDAKWLSL